MALSAVDELIHLVTTQKSKTENVHGNVVDEKRAEQESVDPIIPGNKVIVITGVTSGIGKALAIQFTKQGYTVAGCGRNEESLTNLSKQFDETKNLFNKVDVSDYNQVEKWAKQVCETLGSPRLLINNAAIMVNKNILDCSFKEFDMQIQNNVSSQFYVIKSFMPFMKKNDSMKSFIACMGSANFAQYEPNMAGYITGKFAIEGLVRTLACEIPKHIGICCMWPGGIGTPMNLKAMGKDLYDSLNFMTPDEFASLETIEWFLKLNRTKHNGKTIGPPAELQSFLRFEFFPTEESAKPVIAGKGYPFPYILFD